MPFLELVQLVAGGVLCDAGESMRYIYFPTDAIVSLLYTIKDGSALEIAMVGNEGIVGLALFMGGETTLNRAMVQSPGSAYRLKGQLLKTEFDQAGVLQQQMLRYTQALLTQMAQRLVCAPAFTGSAALQLAAAVFRALAEQSLADDSGADRPPAWCAPRQRLGSGE